MSHFKPPHPVDAMVPESVLRNLGQDKTVIDFEAGLTTAVPRGIVNGDV